MPSFPMAPWHLWGNSVPLSTIVGGIGFTTAPTGQLARISYARPETWRFLFGAVVTQVPADSGVDKIDLLIDFDLIVGIGRSNIKIESFAELRINEIPSNLLQQTLWTSAVETRPAPVISPPSSGGTFVDTVVAQDIQCSARVRAAAGVSPLGGTRIGATVHAYFSPNVHIRPEWLADQMGDEMRYRGGEQGGS